MNEHPPGLFGWLDRRYDLRPLVELARHKEVPVGRHSMLWYYLGGSTLFFFLVQIASGVLLLAYYQPGEDTSYETIRFITTEVPFGWLFRAVHAWSAHFMILSLLVHMFSTYFLQAYRRPRELTWITGILLLAVALGFGFSGYLLPWNRLAYFATAVGTDVVKSVPLAGTWMLRVLRGGADVSINTLYRFFALHVVVLPLAAFAVIGLHLLFIQRQGMAPPAGMDRPPRGLRFFPNFALREALFWLVALIGLITLAVVVPYGPGIPGVDWELGEKADPAAPAFPGIKPEWYFLWVYQLLKEFPPHVLGLEGPQGALLVSVVLLVGWALVPWLDRRGRANLPSPAFTDLGVAALIFIAYLMLLAWDVGGGGTEQPDPRRVAWFSAAIVLGLGVLTDAVRFFRAHHRWFVFSGAALLQVALHGLLGVGYLVGGAVAAGLSVLGVAWSIRRGRPLVLLLALSAASAEAEDGELPPPLAKAFAATRDGKPVVPLSLQSYLRAQPEHLRSRFAQKMEAGLIGGPDHVGRLLALQLSGQDFEWLLSDNCILCHSDPDAQPEDTLFFPMPARPPAASSMGLEEAVADVHFRAGLSCSGCHGGAPTDEQMTPAVYQSWPAKDVRHQRRSWIPAFCAKCHADPQRMREFAPKLPTDQLAKYRTSRHGVLLLERQDDKAAQCVSCHGAHGIRGAGSPRSKVHPTRVPGTCGACHADPQYMAGYTVDGRPIPTDQLSQYLKSVHGTAVMQRQDFGAPACNDCHGNHAAMPPGLSAVSRICRTCHDAEANYFDASTHKRAFDRHGWPECAQCHGQHLIERPTEQMLANRPGTVCFDCHKLYSPDNPLCSTMPSYFRERIDRLETAIGQLRSRSDRLAERGLNVEPLEGTISDIEDALANSRTRIHAFDKSIFDQSADQGGRAVDKAQGLVAGLREDFRFRTGGLLVSVLVMGGLALAIWLRLRRIEKSSSG